MKYIKLVVSLLLISSSRFKPVTAQFNSSCFSLQGSKACPAYSSYYISLTGNEATYPFLANVTDINSFDIALSNYVTSLDVYPYSAGCTSPSATIPYARYSKSYLCASLVQDSLYSLPCNYQHSKPPPPLCQSTCYDYTASINDITDNTLLCPTHDYTVAYLNMTCQIWVGLNGTTSCVLGRANEPEFCGFSNQITACDFCRSNSTDSCCQSLSGCHRLSTGVIIGIVIGCLVFVGGLGAVVFFFCFNKKGHQKLQRTSMLRNGDLHNENTLAYESLGSKNTLYSHQPSKHEIVENNQPPPLQAQLDDFYEVKHPYPPQMGDELGLHVGDIVCMAMNFDDGWALGFNVTTGLKGVFPVVCVAPAPEELLEQLLQTDQPATGKIWVEDNGQLQQICENIRRSMSITSKHVPPPLEYQDNIPRRTASMMRRDYGYTNGNSLPSPTSHTPFFDNHHPTSQRPEIIEMHHKHFNRVSKLQQEE